MQFVLTKPKAIRAVPRPERGLQLTVMPIARIASATVCPCASRTSTWRSLATISSGLCLFRDIAVLLQAQEPYVGSDHFKGGGSAGGVRAGACRAVSCAILASYAPASASINPELIFHPG